MHERCPNREIVEVFGWAIDRVDEITAEETESEQLSDTAQLAMTQLQTEMVDKSLRVARTYGCAICGSMEVDLSTGRLHCGEDAPEEVLQSNERIEFN